MDAHEHWLPFAASLCPSGDLSSYQSIRYWDETTVHDCLSENIGLDSSRRAVIEDHVGPKSPLFISCENGETKITGESEPTWVRTSAIDFFVESVPSESYHPAI